jgi:hypothetical protein
MNLLVWCLDEALSVKLNGFSCILSVTDVAALDIDFTITSCECIPCKNGFFPLTERQCRRQEL